jgi:hypothetical protein
MKIIPDDGLNMKKENLTPCQIKRRKRILQSLGHIVTKVRAIYPSVFRESDESVPEKLILAPDKSSSQHFLRL